MLRKMFAVVLVVLFAAGLLLTEIEMLYANQEEEEREIALPDEEQSDEYDKEFEELMKEEMDDEKDEPEEDEQSYPDEKYQDDRG